MKSLDKSLDILEIFLNGESEMTLTDIAEKSHLNKTTLSRILKTFVKRGYLKQREKRGKYSLGTLFIEFSGVIKGNIKIRDVAIPRLVELSRLVKESVILAVWDGNDAILTETIYPTRARAEHDQLKVVPDEGSKSPLHCTSVGKIILADRTEKELQQYFENRRNARFTPKTITDIDGIRQHLSLVREKGVAFDDEEYSIGVRSVSAGLRNSEGRIIGAIGVLGPSVRLERAKMEELAGAIKTTALDISRELGYKG
jgi:IclR family KDG regulon transcriptional repressor